MGDDTVNGRCLEKMVRRGLLELVERQSANGKGSADHLECTSLKNVPFLQSHNYVQLSR